MDPKNPYRTPTSDLSLSPTARDATGPLDPSGRFARLSWLAWNLLLGLLGFLVGAALVFAGLIELPDPATAAQTVPGMPIFMGFGVLAFQVLFLVFYLILAIRRFHDMDASGWWSALLIVPALNVAAMLVLAIKSGTPGGNRFGPPRETRGWEKVLGYVSIGFLTIGLIGTVAAIALPFLMGLPPVTPGIPAPGAP